MIVYTIYGLFDPITGELRYVGRTHKPLIRRYREHVAPSVLKKNTHRSAWIKSLFRIGQKPTISAIQILYIYNDVNDAEKYWIKYFRDIGCNLTNNTDGGEGRLNYICTDETRQKLSNAMKGKKLSKETKDKISAIHKGHNRSRGRKYSDEARLNMSMAQRARYTKKRLNNDT